MLSEVSSMKNSVSDRKGMEAAVTGSPLLPFNHLRHSKKCSVGIGGARECGFLGQRLAQSFRHIFAIRVRKSLAALLRGIDAVPIRNLRHPVTPRGIEFVKPMD